MDEGQDLGPMHGIPFAIKDVFDVKGWPVRWGSRLHTDRRADVTSAAVQTLLAGGAIPLGLVATYEIATVGPDPTGLYQQPANPWNEVHITGGSSSGSAAAVSAGMVRAAIGTDTGGSVRSPSSYCGIVGLKPTFGSLSKEGMMRLSPSFDHIGAIGRSVGDAAALFSALSMQDISDTGDINGMHLAYGRNWATEGEGYDAMLAVLDAAASSLSLCGAKVDIVQLPDYTAIERAGSDILLAECYEVHGNDVEANPDAVGAMARASILSGGSISADRLSAARASIAPLRAMIDTCLADHDALILPTTMTTAPEVGEFSGGKPVWTAMRTLPFNMTGHPAVSVPMGFVGGLPLGLQIVGRHGDERTVLRIGAAFEAATDHASLQPPLI